MQMTSHSYQKAKTTANEFSTRLQNSRKIQHENLHEQNKVNDNVERSASMQTRNRQYDQTSHVLGAPEISKKKFDNKLIQQRSSRDVSNKQPGRINILA
jgi:hypothetical protein